MPCRTRCCSSRARTRTGPRKSGGHSSTAYSRIVSATCSGGAPCGRVIAWLPFRGDEDDEELDPIAQAPSPEPQPAQRLELDQAIGALEKALGELPRRQQQAFLLRALEGLDVAATALAMGCSQGSVKTHYFRAVQALRAQLGDLYV